jgi:hypothetical protein
VLYTGSTGFLDPAIIGCSWPLAGSRGDVRRCGCAGTSQLHLPPPRWRTQNVPLLFSPSFKSTVPSSRKTC